MKSIFHWSIVLVLAGLITACDTGSGGGGTTTPPKVNPFDALINNPDVNKNAFYTSLAVLCSEGEPRPGCNYRYDGKKAKMSQDPNFEKLGAFEIYYADYMDSRLVQRERDVWNNCATRDSANSCVGGYVKEFYTDTEYFTNHTPFLITPDGTFFKLNEWGLYKSKYAALANGWDFYQTNNGTVNYGVYVSPTGIKYEKYGSAGKEGSALNAAQIAGGANGKDVVGSVAEVRADQVLVIAEGLQAKFALDADVSEKAAASLVDWSEIGSKRARTRADMAAFSERVYGIELGRIEDVALLARDGKAELAIKEMDSLVGQAASNWKTSPETMREVLNFFYGNLME